ncbi:MAG TPA: ABC transporter substrate-binding protein [Candidatus Paceibacterota bacterium]
MKKIIVIFVVGIVVISAAVWFFYFRLQTNKNIIPTQEVTLSLKWLHQAQFTGNYVAVEKGFYKEQGLKVNLVPYDFKNTSIDSVVNGKADFGIAGADELLLAREKGAPIKAIAVIYKTNPVVAYSLKKSGIIKPQDFIGKTVGIEKGVNVEYLYNAMMDKLKIDRSKIKEVAVGYDAKELLDGSVDVSTGYIINEPNIVKETGQEINTMLVSDYGVNMYADVIFTTENLINTNPDLVGRFLAASLEGWQYSIENGKEAVDLTLKYATNSSLVHQQNMLSESIPLINDGSSPVGWMELSQWEQAYNILLEQKILSKPVNIKDAFTMQFLSNYYLNKNI